MKKLLKLKGFTLSELLVVLVIVGILVLLALPSLMPLISKTRSLEAKQQLKHVYTLQKSFFYEYARYSDDFFDLGFEQQPLVTNEPPGTANYIIEIVEATPSSFVATATSIVDFDSDGNLNRWEINEKGIPYEVIKD